MNRSIPSGQGPVPCRPLSGPRTNRWRTAQAPELAEALINVRQHTLALMQAWHEALPDLQVPQEPLLNPPLWEWGHVAWFQEWWTVRNSQRHEGLRSASRGAGFAPSRLPQADALYDSSAVAHASRWTLPLPDLPQTRDYLEAVLTLSLTHLMAAPDPSDDALYFWRLALQHEAMHNEAAVYMAQHLGLPLAPHWVSRCDERSAVERDPSTAGEPGAVPQASLTFPAHHGQMGHGGAGFAFDNECGTHPVDLQAFEIDRQAVTWSRYLPFLQATGHPPAPHTRRHLGSWQVQHLGHWQTMDLQAPAVHINALDAQAWCQWAGRRLPTEAEWATAAQHPDFIWGQVWEWTASDFVPFAGFVAHPYRDYSEPWWSTHRVLRGASTATSVHVLDVRFRNFFRPERRDILAGFRSVSL